MPKSITIQTAHDQPLEIYGYGSNIKSSIIINNPENNSIRIKNIDIKGTNPVNKLKLDIRTASLNARMHAGQTKKFPFQFEIDPATPPGSYKGEMNLNQKQPVPFVFHVLENFKLSALPSNLVFHGIPGKRLSKELVISNDGNIDINIGNEINGSLIKANELHQMASFCLTDNAGAGAMRIFEDILFDLQNIESHAVTLTIKNKNTLLKAGETKKFSTILTPPEKLQPGQLYHGKLNLFNINLSILFQCMNNKKEG